MSSWEPIAIIGQGCLLPGCFSPEALWTTVAQGQVNLTPMPEGDWSISGSSGNRPSWFQKIPRLGGHIEGFADHFNPQDYALDPALTAALDPLFQWTLAVVRQALASAGEANQRYLKDTGLYLGNLSYPTMAFRRYFEETYEEALFPGSAHGPAKTHALNRFMSGGPALLVKQVFGLGLEAVALDAACASSLYALKFACDQLQNQSAKMMLAAGINGVEPFFLQAGFASVKAVSPSGQSRPFHREADGLIPANGAACVVLKRMSDAVRDQDTIMGVIQGLGLSNDGHSRSFLLPGSAGQVRCMQAAFDQAGISPAEIGYVECHATGTASGDQTEIRSMARIFNGVNQLTIGSLKANLGHLITASGLAGLIKVLAAMHHELLPATPNAFPVMPELEQTPFHVLEKSEPWRAKSRLACISNFGFGGNNAHVIVSQYHPAHRKPKASKPAVKPKAVAVVGLAVRARQLSSRADLLEFLLTNQTNPAETLESMNLPATELTSPPKDLEQALGQQLLLLDLARKALQSVTTIDASATGVFIGMGIDAEVNRFGLNWRLPTLLTQWGVSLKNQEQSLKTAIGPELTAAGLVGTMPNIPANRLNHHFDFQGPGLTIACEELSGDHALALAAQAIGQGELRAALVGAVDFSQEKMHDRAARNLGLLKTGQTGLDGGVVMVLKNKEDALADGDTILATLEKSASPTPALMISNSPQASPLLPGLGHSHAASGLLHIAAAMLLAAQRATPGSHSGPAGPGQALAATHQVTIHNQSFLGSTKTTHLRHDAVSDQPQLSLRAGPKLSLYAADDRLGLRRALEQDRPHGKGPWRVAFFGSSQEKNTLRQKALQHLQQDKPAEGWHPDGFAFGSAAVPGELAFVYTGAAAAYAQTGRSLWMTYPGLVQGLLDKIKDPQKARQWIQTAWTDEFRQPFHQLIGTTVMAQIHTQWSRKVLGLKPKAAIGLSAGETNALLAFDLWQDMDLLLEEIEKSGTYTHALGGPFEAVATYWGSNQQATVAWENWRLFAPREVVEAALKQEQHLYLTIVYTDQDCMIGGDAQACRRVVDVVGKDRAVLVDNQFAIHCPPVQAFSESWRKLHTRPMTPVKGIKLYSSFFGGVYDPTVERIAQALTGQAVGVIDFPKLIRQAWQDGLRIFVEHGPRSTLTSSINTILKDKPHLALAWDKYGHDPLHQLYKTTCELWCAGVEVACPLDLQAAGSNDHQPRLMTFNLHKPEIRLSSSDSEPMAPPPPIQEITAEKAQPTARRLPPAPRLAPVLDIKDGQAGAEPRPSSITQEGPVPANFAEPRSESAIDRVKRFHDRLLEAQQAYLSRQAEAYQATLQVLQNLETTTPVNIKVDQQPEAKSSDSMLPTTTAGMSQPSALAADQHNRTAEVGAGRCFDHQALLIHSAGKISDLFGALFQKQDTYAVQVRLPEPPLLLADSIMGLEGEPGSHGQGSLWSETTVHADSWYLHHGRMPAGIFVESGQADLFLISWLGADLLNQGERAYRLLGCELTYHGELPKPGDVLRYHITITGYAQQGGVRLFFFENDCWINGERRLSVRHGQAGFFTAQELQASAGALWDPAAAPYAPQAKIEWLERHTTKQAFSEQEVTAYTQGDIAACFGEAFKDTATHTRTPRSQEGRMNFIGAVTTYDLHGGPAGQGYLRAETAIDPKAWYFDCHFKNDPCMPGTLMAEAGLQLMAFYMTGAGLTITRDGWRFEPATGQSFKFVCRGQVVPSSRHMTYELFVDELISGPQPSLRAHLLCTVDGVKAFLCEHMVLRLVPDWPLTSMPDLLASLEKELALPCAEFEGFTFDHRSLLYAALGQPSLAFGPRYQPYDHEVRPLRLPGPPFHFMSRIVELQAQFGVSQGKPAMDCDYDIPAEAWYLRENPSGLMPFSVLMEIGLQPCGWLAAFTNPPEMIGREWTIRNLDGTARIEEPMVNVGQTIHTHLVLISSFRTEEVIINKYEVECRLNGRMVLRMDTVFGIFPPQAMGRQKGFPVEDKDSQWQQSSGQAPVRLTPEASPHLFQGTAALPAGRLLMIERIVHDNPQGGAFGQGLLVAEKKVEPGDWFFKAHFYQDPVQPGSLGLEAIIQVLQYFLLSRHHHEGMVQPVLEPVELGQEVEWHYRGQVTPACSHIRVVVTIKETGKDDLGPWVHGQAGLWADQLKIFNVPKISMRLREKGSLATSAQNNSHE